MEHYNKKELEDYSRIWENIQESEWSACCRKQEQLFLGDRRN